MKDEQKKVKAFPVLIGPKNAEAAVGFPWRWVADTSTALGVPFVGHGRKRGVRADAFLAALEKTGAYTNGGAANTVEPAAALPFTPADTAAHVRALLGKKLKVGP